MSGRGVDPAKAQFLGLVEASKEGVGLTPNTAFNRPHAISVGCCRKNDVKKLVVLLTA